MVNLKILCILIFNVFSFSDSVDLRRPIWNVAHMVNSLWQVDYYLDKGANSLEFDVTFDWKGEAKYTFHGMPCDCFRTCMRYEDIDTFIDYLRVLTTPGNPNFREHFVLLFFDLKVNGLTPPSLTRAGENLANKLLDLYWQRGKSGARAYVLISMPSVNQIEVAKSFKKTLQAFDAKLFNEKIGFDFSGNEDLNLIHSVLSSVKVSDQIWQGDGITNCLPRSTRRLLEAISKRDRNHNNEYVDKVYWWTVDKMSTMRTTLRLGVDGMITNYPHRLIEVLKEEAFSRIVRLATIEDNPWVKHPKQTSNLALPPEMESKNLTEMEEEILYNS